MLNEKELIKLIDKGSLFEEFLKGFEPRLSQKKMMSLIIEAFNGSKISLLEVGTGTGKTVAYLIPAIFSAIIDKKKTVISTHTITLQEQILNKDIPLITQALGLDLKVVLVKGMNHYLCLRKLRENLEDIKQLPYQQAEEVLQISQWAEKTKEGSKQDLSALPSKEVWEKCHVELETCNHSRCPFFQKCFFFKARQKAQDAHVLIANHHLYFSDLSIRKELEDFTNPYILPPHSQVIFDEAHHLEDVASQQMAQKTSHLELIKVFKRLINSPKGQRTGKVWVVYKKLKAFLLKNPEQQERVSPLIAKIDLDLVGLERECFCCLDDFFFDLESLILKFSSNNNLVQSERLGVFQLRITEDLEKHPSWKNDICEKLKPLQELIKRLSYLIDTWIQSIRGIENSDFNSKVEGPLMEVQSLTLRLTNTVGFLADFFFNKITKDHVRWLELYSRGNNYYNISLSLAQMDISKTLKKSLFEKYPSISLISATLSTNNNFKFIKQSLGIDNELEEKKQVCEAILDSPFDYNRQVLFAAPKDFPSPKDPKYKHFLIKNVLKTLESSKGGAFILFTSYKTLRMCFEQLEKPLKEKKLWPMKQGDESRSQLLLRFKKTKGGVLFATSSFWEGVDVVGDSLKCIIIPKLPFKVPSEPMTQARHEWIEAQGRSSFWDYDVPHAIVKFKQGFGRLIRNKKDWGCVVCFDSRLIHKGYGKAFVQSLPPCEKNFSTLEEVHQIIKSFYQHRHKTPQTA